MSRNSLKKRKVSASISRVYSDVNSRRPKSYYDYEKLVIPWGDQKGYEVSKNIGKGKYSEVFKGINIYQNRDCVIKVLKPVALSTIKREIKVLQNLCGGANIIALLDCVRGPTSTTSSLIFEYIDTTDFKKLSSQLKDNEMRYYFYQLLKALDYSHSQGIMHCDIKPDNVLIDHKNRQVRIIDWGLAEFYHVGKEYIVHVGTRYWKAPELLTQKRDYDYSLDIWSLGAMFAGRLFDKYPFFKGADNVEQLLKIVEVLGSKDLLVYLKKYDIELHPALHSELLQSLGQYSKKSWQTFVNDKNKHLISKEALDFLDTMLQYDHQLRPTCKEAMLHPYFELIRIEEQTQKGIQNNMEGKEDT